MYLVSSMVTLEVLADVTELQIFLAKKEKDLHCMTILWEGGLKTTDTWEATLPQEATSNGPRQTLLNASCSQSVLNSQGPLVVLRRSKEYYRKGWMGLLSSSGCLWPRHWAAAVLPCPPTLHPQTKTTVWLLLQRNSLLDFWHLSCEPSDHYSHVIQVTFIFPLFLQQSLKGDA